LKKVSVDVVSVVENNLFKGWDVMFLELAEGEVFGLDEFPLVSKLQDGRPYFDRAIVDRVLSGIRY